MDGDGGGESLRRPNRPLALSKENISRLSTPKAQYAKYIPDKPSVYWLDYILDPTPREIIDPKELYSYYQKFTTPRLMKLSKPKPRLSTVSSESLGETTKTTSSTGISLSALQYEPSDRIKKLSEPRSTKSQSGFIKPTSFSVNVRGTQSCSTYWPRTSTDSKNGINGKIKIKARR